MQEQRYDGAEYLTENPSAADIFAAIQNPENREVRLLPDIEEPKEYYIIKKRGKWKKVKNKNYDN